MPSNDYSAHPALAAYQLQRANSQLADSRANNQNQIQQRRQRNVIGNSSLMKPAKRTPKKFISRTCVMASAKAIARSVLATKPAPTTTTATTTLIDKCSTNQEAAEPHGNATTRRESTEHMNTATAVATMSAPQTMPNGRTNPHISASTTDAADDEQQQKQKLKVMNSEESVKNVKNVISTKEDCVIAAAQNQLLPPSSELPSGSDEVDNVALRFPNNNNNKNTSSFSSAETSIARLMTMEQEQEHKHKLTPIGLSVDRDGGYMSGFSSIISSPSVSTMSSPLSTPSKHAPIEQLQHSHHQHQQHHHQHHCCHHHFKQHPQHSHLHAHPQHHQYHSHSHSHRHYHHHLCEHQQRQHQQRQQQQELKVAPGTCCCTTTKANNIDGGGGSNCCKQHKKQEPTTTATRPGGSAIRQILPVVMCVLSFAIVFAILIIYMDTTEIRHQQFRLNMTRDYEMTSVAQDDPQLVTFVRRIQMRKYPRPFEKAQMGNQLYTNLDGNIDVDAYHVAAKAAASRYANLSASGVRELAPAMALYATDLVGGKRNGAAIQSLTGSRRHLIMAPWLSEALDWMTVIVEPDPQEFFKIRLQNLWNKKAQIVHACISNSPHPKEIVLHNDDDDDDVRVNSVHDDDEEESVCPRVKCFPLYTLILACERRQFDLISLGLNGKELEALKTLPFDKVSIEVISIHLTDEHDSKHGYVKSITRFLAEKAYKLQRKFVGNYFYKRLNGTATLYNRKWKSNNNSTLSKRAP